MLLEKLVCVYLACLSPEKAGASWYMLDFCACLQRGFMFFLCIDFHDSLNMI